jgi:hypothetical protein
MCKYLHEAVEAARKNEKKIRGNKRRISPRKHEELCAALSVMPLRKTILLAGHYICVSDAWVWNHFHNIASPVFASTPICIQTLS